MSDGAWDDPAVQAAVRETIAAGLAPICGISYEHTTWSPGDISCHECGADLSEEDPDA